MIEENENIVEEVTDVTEESTQPIEEVEQKIDESKFDSAGDDSVIKVDLSKPPTPEESETKEDNADDSGVVAESENADTSQEQEEVQPETETQETSVLEEITEEKVEEKVEEIADVAEEAIKENIETGKPLPENIQKLMDFMEETGGDLNDYVNLNKDVSKMDDSDILGGEFGLGRFEPR